MESLFRALDLILNSLEEPRAHADPSVRLFVRKRGDILFRFPTQTFSLTFESSFPAFMVSMFLSPSVLFKIG